MQNIIFTLQGRAEGVKTTTVNNICKLLKKNYSNLTNNETKI